MILMYYLSGIFFFVYSLIVMLLGLTFMLFKLSIFIEWNLLGLNSVFMNMFIYLDWMSLIFIFCVLLISSMIMFYCCEYMSHDLSRFRFFYLVFFFIISMFLMILSPNMVSIILGWDGLGLVSYCLVIYYQNYFSYNSGMLTVLMNRVGDVMIMISISLMMMFGSWNFMNLNVSMFFLVLIVMVASFTKSAQFPFSSWLPAAMAAPTPVSSLVHSSTLVTAGLYLLIRFYFLIYKNDLILFLIYLIGMITMMMAGFSAIFEFDLKKIIAYSTLSQLGLMMVIFGMKFYELTFFHLVVHAMFKSMMFMCSGVIIHSMINIQDIRFMGNLIEFMPFTLVMFMISNFSLCGLPFMSGFYSKDLILEKLFMELFTLLFYLFLMLSTALTVIYSIRLLYYLVGMNFNFFVIFKVKDFKIMNFSMFILMINSIYFGYVFNWLIFLNIEEINLLFFEKIQVLMLCIFSFFIGKMMVKMNFKSNSFLKFFMGKMNFYYYMNFYFYSSNLNWMKKYYLLVDKGLMEYFFGSLLIELLKIFNYKIFSNNFLLNFMFFVVYLFLLMFIL
uniref:NADH-ubiquinone oxidoreductase chain 5 n=1 Tax=Psyllaephagus populi TaxID=3122998 RepID=A0AAU7BNE9_9HYME